MSLADVLLQFGAQVGWNLVLTLLFAYELFFPKWLHPTGGTRLQKLLYEPNPAVIAALEAISDEMDSVDEDIVKEWFNGDKKRPSDLKVDPSEAKRQ